MVGAVVFLVGGIVFGRYFSLYEHLLIFALLVCALAITYFFAYKRKIALIFPAFALLGAFFVVSALAPRDATLEEVAERHGFVRIEGVVQDISLTRTGRQRVALHTSTFRIGPAADVHYAAVGVMAFLPEGEEAALGQRVVVSGYLLPLDGVRNPGGFNEFQFLRSRGIDYKIFAESVRAYEVNLTLSLHIRNFGMHLADVFDQVLPPEMAGIMKAMIVGDRSGLDSDVRDAYRAVGMFHILVVSGLHVAVLVAFVERSLKFFGMGLKKRSLITILFIIAFAILTGAGVATVRASIMGIALIASGLLGYENDTPTSMSIAAIILLLYQPLFLFDPGFIYSFSVVAALVFATTPTQKALDMLAARWPRSRPFLENWYVKKYLAGTIAANMAYIPVNSYIFFEFSPLSPPVNFLLMPSVFFVIVLGFLMAIVGIFGGIGMFAATILGFPIWILLTVYNFVINTSLRLPFSTILTGRPGLFAMVMMTAAIVFFIHTFNTGHTWASKCRPYIFAGFVLAFVTSFIIGAASPYINTTFLYVGQGESAVISRGRSGLIIDGGGVFGRDVGENMGSFVVMPYLNYRGIGQATAIVTHNHRDHSLGIAEALFAGRIDHLILARANSQPDYYMYDMLLYAAELSGATVTYVTAGDVIEFYDARLYVLFPYGARLASGENDSSMVLRMVHGGHSILFTGDIEAAAESYLATRGNLSADILQVAHHGSRTSTTQAFLEAVNPQKAIISAGRNNMFHHPHPSVTRRLYDHGVTYHVTAERGAILVRTSGQSMEIRTMAGQ